MGRTQYSPNNLKGATMKNMGIKLAIFFGSSAIGLLVASLSLRGFRMTFWGFLVAVVVFSVAQSIVAPLVAKLIEKYAASAISLVGIISAFLALLVATLFTGGLRISDVGTWVLATLLVWIIPAIATMLLPKVFSSAD